MPDSTISITCPTCSAKVRAPLAALGKKTKCPRCKAELLVEQGEARKVAAENVSTVKHAAAPTAESRATISVTCPTCQSKMKAPAALEGTSARCPKCSEVVKVVKPVEPPLPVLSLDDDEPKPVPAAGKHTVELDWRLFLLYSVAAVLLFAGLLTGLWMNATGPSRRASGDRLTRESFMRIQPGMSHADVKLILGHPTRILNQYGPLSEPVIYEYEYVAGGPRARIVVSSDGQVITKTQTGLD